MHAATPAAREGTGPLAGSRSGPTLSPADRPMLERTAGAAVTSGTNGLAVGAGAGIAVSVRGVRTAPDKAAIRDR